MEFSDWILFFAICVFSASSHYSTEEHRFEALLKINSFDCWNNGKNKYMFPAPEFTVGDEENLSFNDCGRWNNSKIDRIAPWTVFITFGNGYLPSILISDQTVLSYRIDPFYNAVAKGKKLKVFGGGCADKRDLVNCFHRRGLLSQKVLDFKEVFVQNGQFFRESIYIWRIEKVKLTPKLQPACLWNQDNQNDDLEYFYSDNWRLQAITQADFLAENSCYNERRVEKWRCDLYGNSICTSASSQLGSEYLFIRREDRSYLRAIYVYDSEFTMTWFDLLPYTNEIVSASFNLAAMPVIPDLKSRIDFGVSQSFANCGRVSGRRSKRVTEEERPGGLIFNGQNAVRGQHPWHASLSVQMVTGSVEDSCGATLISKKALVTAAHCLFDREGLPLRASHVDVTLGMYNRSSKAKESSRQTLRASNLVVHPGYNHSRGDFKDDIALIIVTGEVQFSDYVAPICLWNFDYDLDRIANRTGTLVGWGLTSNYTQPDILQEASIKVVSYKQCYESKKRFFSLYMRPRENFCAGFPHNQTGACNGDSGGGFSLYDRLSRRHFLRGVVSMGNLKKVIKNDQEVLWTCNPNYYALYTDVVNYMRSGGRPISCVESAKVINHFLMIGCKQRERNSSASVLLLCDSIVCLVCAWCVRDPI
ncbi:transmembrane protease serine 11D-like [Neocloeon triangulifer]|uniref:transmembrane protease serine 11D-like n=1 Tax=Neocloeon triangulifer TaxID=2078957 RepID=UPI00286EFE13|nr:transmembrane protease serine 11D-like [Neocloeon triangulifer]